MSLIEVQYWDMPDVPKAQVQICDCGHMLGKHRSEVFLGHQSRRVYCQISGCDCTKYRGPQPPVIELRDCKCGHNKEGHARGLPSICKYCGCGEFRPC